MAWPSDQDYNEAIQSPRIAFADQELQSGQVELNAMGIPKARSGNFATVYKVTANGAAYAVRCFRHDNPEHKVRYPEIASYLTQNRLPYMVGFHYRSQGIRVGGSWYPFLKMRWIDGDTLVSYIEKNLSSPAVLRDLATEWREMLDEMRQANIAHGDLQHGNVLVESGKLRLVDYDGMYVPTLEGRYGIEIGHRNYQHPQRTELDFGAYLDNFSGWLIHASLVAIAAKPTLWGKLNGGDECLLFRKEDFDAPERSAAFHVLKALPDAQIRALADRIEQFLWLPPDQVPAVSDQELAALQSEPSTEASDLDWVQDYGNQTSGDASDELPAIEAGDQSWVQDHLGPAVDIGSFNNNVRIDRNIGLVAVLTAFSLCFWLSLSIAPLLALTVWIGGAGMASLMTLVGLAIRYRTEPAFSAITALRSDLAELGKQYEDANGDFEQFKKKRLRRRSSFIEDGSRLQKREAALHAEQVIQLREIENRLQGSLQQTTNRMRAAAIEEGTEKRKLAETVGGEISRLSHLLSALPNQERQELLRIDNNIGERVSLLASQLQQVVARRDGELRMALKTYQDQVVNGELQRFRLAEASVPGIGPQLKQRLAVAGFTSAGDIGTRYSEVPGVGAKKWAALHAWRQQLELPIRAAKAPRSLPPHKTADIEQRYETQIRQIRQNLSQEQVRLATAKQNVTTQIIDQKRSLELQKAAAENNLRQGTAAVEKEFNEERKKIIADERSLRSEHRHAVEKCRNESRAAVAELTQEANHIKNDYRASLDQLNKEIEVALKRVREISWRRNRVQQQYSAYRSLGFRQYIMRVVGRS